MSNTNQASQAQAFTAFCGSTEGPTLDLALSADAQTKGQAEDAFDFFADALTGTHFSAFVAGGKPGADFATWYTQTMGGDPDDLAADSACSVGEEVSSLRRCFEASVSKASADRNNHVELLDSAFGSTDEALSLLLAAQRLENSPELQFAINALRRAHESLEAQLEN